jgi:AbiV family abortive infection protein
MPETFTTEEAIRGFKLSLQNAGALLEDSRVLRDAGRPHRAIALAALALEELGKCPRYFNAYRFERTGQMKKFWDQFKIHHVKTKIGVQFAKRPQLPGERAAQIFDLWLGTIGNDIHSRKMASFYTDFDFESGRFVSPLEMADDEAAGIAEELIAHGKKLAKLFHFTASTARAESWDEARIQIDAEVAKYSAGTFTDEELESTSFFVANMMHSPDGYDPDAPIEF